MLLFGAQKRMHATVTLGMQIRVRNHRLQFHNQCLNMLQRKDTDTDDATRIQTKDTLAQDVFSPFVHCTTQCHTMRPLTQSTVDTQGEGDAMICGYCFAVKLLSPVHAE